MTDLDQRRDQLRSGMLEIIQSAAILKKAYVEEQPLRITDAQVIDLLDNLCTVIAAFWKNEEEWRIETNKLEDVNDSHKLLMVQQTAKIANLLIVLQSIVMAYDSQEDMDELVEHIRALLKDDAIYKDGVRP